MNRYKIKYNYCAPGVVVEHHELRCTEHLSRYELCPSAPAPARKEALTRLATKRDARLPVSLERHQILTSWETMMKTEFLAGRGGAVNCSGKTETKGCGSICGPRALD